MNRIPLARIVALSAGLSLLAAAGAAAGWAFGSSLGGHLAPPQARVLRKHGLDLQKFALDGTRLTWAAWNGRCENLYTWDLYAGGWKSSGITGDCYGGPIDIAAADGRIAWLLQSASISSGGFELLTARYGGPRKSVLATDAPIDSVSGDAGGLDSREIGDLVGAGATIAFLTWTVHPSGQIAGEQAWKLDREGRPTAVADVPGARALAIDGNDPVVLSGDATLHFFGASPRAVKLSTNRAALQSRRSHDLAIADGRAVVLGRRSLQVFDASTGALDASWPLPVVPLGSRGLLEAAGGFASYLERDAIHVVRLVDGKNIVIRHTRMQLPKCFGGDVWAHLGSLGLVYSLAPGKACRTSRAGLITFAELETHF